MNYKYILIQDQHHLLTGWMEVCVEKSRMTLGFVQSNRKDGVVISLPSRLLSPPPPPLPSSPSHASSLLPPHTSPSSFPPSIPPLPPPLVLTLFLLSLLLLLLLRSLSGWDMPYHLVPVLHKADEALQLGWTVPQEGSLQLREAGGELALSPQELALLDKLDVDFRVRAVAFDQLTCRELIHNVKMSAFL